MVLQLPHYLFGLLVLAQADLDLASALTSSRHNVLFELCAHNMFSARHLPQPGCVNILIDADQIEFDEA